MVTVTGRLLSVDPFHHLHLSGPKPCKLRSVFGYLHTKFWVMRWAKRYVIVCSSNFAGVELC